MKCHFHQQHYSIASCLYCNIKLCKTCSEAHGYPVCFVCYKRQLDKFISFLFKIIIPSSVGIILSIIVGYFLKLEIFHIYVIGYIFAGIPWGLKKINKTIAFLPYNFVFILLIKIIISIFIGIWSMPLEIAKIVKEEKRKYKKLDKIQFRAEILSAIHFGNL